MCVWLLSWYLVFSAILLWGNIQRGSEKEENLDLISDFSVHIEEKYKPDTNKW